MLSYTTCTWYTKRLNKKLQYSCKHNLAFIIIGLKAMALKSTIHGHDELKVRNQLCTTTKHFHTSPNII